MKKYSYDEHAEISVNEAIRALTEKPVKTTTLERIRLFNYADENVVAGMCQPRALGYGLKYVLENISLPIKDYDLLVGRATEELPDEEGEAFFQFILKKPGYSCCRPSWAFDDGHCSLSWDKLLSLGITGLKKEAEERYLEIKNTEDIDKVEFLEGAIAALDAMLIYMERYAVATEEKGMNKVSEVCRALTHRAPESFREAMQLLWFVTFVFCAYLSANPTLTLGRLDFFLYSFYKNDIEKGTLTREEAKALILDYYCKHNLIMGRGEHQLSGHDENVSTGWARCLCYDAPQYLTLGGRDINGKDITNELTLLFVECIVPRFKNPVVVFHYSPGYKDNYSEVWRAVVSKMRDNSSMMVYNEENSLTSYDMIGVPREDTYSFEHHGCNHPNLPGIDVTIMHTSYNAITPLISFIVRCAEEGRELSSREELYGFIRDEAIKKCRADCEAAKTRYSDRMKLASKRLTFADLFYRDTFKYVNSSLTGGCKYYFVNWQMLAYASLVDIIVALDELCIKTKTLTLKRLVEAMSANFEGYPAELALCRRAPKLGSDDERANTVARELLPIIYDAVDIVAKEEIDSEKYKGLMVRHSLTTDNGHITAGARTGATPDGRLAGVPFSQNTAPAVGSSVNGLTARLRSMASIPFRYLPSGAQNITIQKKAFDGEEGLTKLCEIIGGYFELGGLQVQISTLSVEELRDAQINPDAHRDITVRITGYSAVFVDMVKSAQDEIIRREEMAE